MSEPKKKIAIAIVHGVGIHNDEDIFSIDTESLLNFDSLKKNIMGFLGEKNTEMLQEKIDKTKESIVKAKDKAKEKAKELSKKIKDEPHGIDGMIQLIQNEYEKNDGKLELVIKPIYWGKRLQNIEKILADKIKDSGLASFKVRELIIYLVGDILAYQPSKSNESFYNEIHKVMQSGLKELADEAGPDAPLCIIAHSLGTVISFNFLKDLLENPPENKTPLERGETLEQFYTMGSPLALYSLQLIEIITDKDGKEREIPFGKPIKIKLWKNIYDKNDLIAYPICNLNEYYKSAPIEDITVNAGGKITSLTMISHTKYWTTPEVIDIIIQNLLKID